MPSRIASYKVGVTRSAKGGPSRWLVLALTEPLDHVASVSLFFQHEKVEELGYLSEETGRLVVNMPVADFDPIYHLLNTEQPVFVHWRTDPEDHRVISIDIATSDEPPGEGTPDRSA